MQNLRVTMMWVLLVAAGFATAKDKDEYADALEIFKSAGESSHFFKTAYGYALFPTIGKGGIGIGGAHGSGKVYVADKPVGTTSMTQLSVGFQLGVEAFSQVIFFEDKRAFDEFTNGNFEFSAQASAIAITAGANASASTTGSSAGASGGQNNATTTGKYYKGMAVFTVAKGGLMYQATVGGQKFSYKPL